MVANQLTKLSDRVLLIESNETAGGYNKTRNGLPFLPGTESGEKAVHFLSDTLEQDISYTIEENEILTFEAGAPKVFLGFGDNKPNFYEEINYFLSAKKIILDLPIHHWVNLLAKKYSGHFLNKSFVTKINSTDEKITSLTINGYKNISAKNYIFCGHLFDLERLLSENILGTKTKQKLAKHTFWTAVCLNLTHQERLTESSSLTLLGGSNAEDLSPCIGNFYSENESLYSEWITYVDSEQAEDSEVISSALKKMKRQIKKAYPTALENASEKITIAPHIAGNFDIKMSLTGNFLIASGLAHKQKNILGSLLQSELAVASMSSQSPHKLAASLDI